MEITTLVTAKASSVFRSWSPEPFSARLGLSGPHRQTLAASLLPRSFLLPQPEARFFQVEPRVRVLCHCHWQQQSRPALTVLLVHGFEGSSHSHYILGTADKAWAAGMNVVRMNIRNCGGTEHLGPTLYHSGLSQDIGVVARELLEDKDRVAGVMIAGFSLGGNQVLKLAGEMGADTPAGLRAVAAVSPGMDLIESSHALHQWRNRLYEWNFLRSVRRTLRRKQRVYPEVCAPDANRWYGSMREFDHCVTAPHFGFTSADDYYTRASASPWLPRISIPALVLASADDPFIHLTSETRRRLAINPSLTFVETRAGGHCGFLAAPRGYDGFWAERQVVGFFRRF
ncbi:MAG: YheT family hydrolase [Candidatus Korobacteraceae bacterium]